MFTSVVTLRDMQHCARGQPRGAWVVGVDQVDVLRAERRRGTNLCTDIGRDVADLIGVDIQLQLGEFPADR